MDSATKNIHDNFSILFKALKICIILIIKLRITNKDIFYNKFLDVF